MTAEQLTQAGTCLYGLEPWMRPLAGELGVDDRTVRRWANGSQPIPQAIAIRVVALLFSRAAEIANLLASFKPVA